jgi:hypothetical protein
VDAALRRTNILAALCCAALLAAALPAFSAEEQAEKIPVIRGELGPCTAEFTVTDRDEKPLYDARIHVLIRYGFLGKRKSELEIGTNSDGKARFEGLPSRVRTPLEFRVRSGDLVHLLVHDPEADCQASFSVKLQKP